MNKKILLSGAAALLLAGSMFATSASASAISLSQSGEAKLKAVFDNECSANDTDLAAVTTITGATTVTNSCAAGDADDMPVWSTESSLDFSASGTLANGLSVSVDQDAVISLSGAFGSVEWKNNGDSAVKKALPNHDGDLTAPGAGIGGHTLKTAGTAGYVVNYSAPSVGGMDIFVSYAPSSGNSDVNDDDYLDTLAFGAKMTAGDITIGAGWETATQNANASGSSADCAGADVVAATGAPLAQSIAAYQGQSCGDQTLMGIGASMGVGDLSLNAGYTKLDTEGGDTTVYNIGLGTTVGDYSLGLNYVNASLDYASAAADAVNSTDTRIGVDVSTALGDGVTLGLAFNNQSVDVIGTGAHTNYHAEAALTIKY
jgi:hypothetical protein